MAWCMVVLGRGRVSQSMMAEEQKVIVVWKWRPRERSALDGASLGLAFIVHSYVMRYCIVYEPAVAGAVRPFVQKGAAASCDYVWVGAMQSAQFSISLYARRFRLHLQFSPGARTRVCLCHCLSPRRSRHTDTRSYSTFDSDHRSCSLLIMIRPVRVGVARPRRRVVERESVCVRLGVRCPVVCGAARGALRALVFWLLSL
jgi:hypothetical protein